MVSFSLAAEKTRRRHTAKNLTSAKLSRYAHMGVGVGLRARSCPCGGTGSVCPRGGLEGPDREGDYVVVGKFFNKTRCRLATNFDRSADVHSSSSVIPSAVFCCIPNYRADVRLEYAASAVVVACGGLRRAAVPCD